MGPAVAFKIQMYRSTVGDIDFPDSYCDGSDREAAEMLTRKRLSDHHKDVRESARKPTQARLLSADGRVLAAFKSDSSWR